MGIIFMKTLLIALSAVLLSTTIYADRPLNPQYGEPMPLGERTQYVEPVKSKYSEKSYETANAYTGSFNIGYVGTKIGSNEMGGDEKFNGLDIGFSSHSNNWVAGLNFTYLNATYLRASQLYSKFGYTIFDQNNTYGITSFGIGYTWVTAKDENAQLEYFTVPAEIEIGHYIQPNLALYGSLGYQWLLNTNAEACVGMYCGSGSSSELDVDGVQYKAGVRFKF